MNQFEKLLKTANNEYASIVKDGIVGDVTHYLSTGSMSLNALLSGSIYSGLPGNKVIALAGEPSTGKTFYAINVVREFLNTYPDGMVFYFESESAINKEMLVERNIDVDRVAIMPVATVQEFRTQATKILDEYIKEKSKDRPKMFFVLDSLGNLSTEKEMADVSEGKDTRDMTRAQLIRGAFRVLTLKLGKANVPLLVTNHVYDAVGSYVPTKKMGGGDGLVYAASVIVFLSKSKKTDKTTNEVTGAIIKAKLVKSRMSIENKKVETLLDYNTGLDPYYGLIDLALKFGIFKKIATKIELPDGKTEFETRIIKNPTKYFTKEILDQIDEKCKAEFLYGKTNVLGEDDDGE